MSLKLALLLALLAASAGIGFGYLLRLIISLGKKGSMELEIKELEMSSKEEAQKVISEAEEKAQEIIDKVQVEIKERETRLKGVEDRLVKKEEFLDKRQVDLDQEVEGVKEKKFVQQRSRGEIVAMCHELQERRNTLLRRYQKNPSEAPRKTPGPNFYLPVGYHMAQTTEPGFRILTRD